MPEIGPEISAEQPHSARIWNYWLGGKDHYRVDEEVGRRIAEQCPSIVDVARTTRAFLARAVRYLAGDVGIRQFLDVGTGLPTVDNTHELAQRIAPESRIVYVDNDPLVLAHAEALLTSTPQGRTAYIDADAHAPEDILARAGAELDLSRPTAVILMGILGHTADDEEARSITGRLMSALPSGSYLVVSDCTPTSEQMITAAETYAAADAEPYHLRSNEQIARLFDGLDLLEPGLVPPPDWRPDVADPHPLPVDAVAGIGRKP